jgi:uncharacterized cupin superfamily protein
MPGSFVLNVADAPAFEHPVAGVRILLERPDAPFPDTGLNIQVLRPGQPNCKYHSEGVQEDFLVLAGECLAIIDGAERRLRAWDFVHCEAGTPHVFVGAGDGPCWILAIGARREEETLDFPAEALAARYGAAAPSRTADGDEAYADWPGGPPPGDAAQVQTPWPPR